MIIWIMIGFAILQGVLEWLPVSSSGQTILILNEALNMEANVALSLSLWLHLGTLIAVFVKYRKELWFYINLKNQEENIKKWRLFLVLSTLGTIIVGIPCYFLVDYFIASPDFGDYSTLVIGIALLVTAIILFISNRENVEGEPLQDISKKKMVGSGLLQGFSIIPGLSRSGITMGGLLMMNVEKNDAIQGSFLMSIPAVLGGFILSLAGAIFDGTNIFPIAWWQLIIAILITAVIGYLTMELFVYIARKFNFAIICLVLGLLAIILFSLRWIVS